MQPTPEPEPTPPGAAPPRLVLDRNGAFASFVLILVAGLIGFVFSLPPTVSVNDRSRWDTVWSLVEWRTYQIFDNPEEAARWGRPAQFPTIDRIVVDREGAQRSYSSKPPLMPTVVAAFVGLLKTAYGAPFDHESIFVYGRLAIVAFNVAPLALLLILYRRHLDRSGVSDFTWCFCLAAAGAGTYLTGYSAQLNNHTIAGTSAFVAAYLLHRWWYEDEGGGASLALAGLAAGWTVANELPALTFAAIALLIVLSKRPAHALAYFLPPLLFVGAAILLTNRLATGSVLPAYAQTAAYRYQHSYWTTPAIQAPIDRLNASPEPYFKYLLHLTIGHHGVFSLTPIWLLACLGAWRNLGRDSTRWPDLAWAVLAVSVPVVLFYWLTPTARNYGGVCHGLRWAIWLGPLWLYLLPEGVEPLARDGRARVFALLLLAVSVFTVADALHEPAGNSWLHRAMLAAGLVAY